MTIYTSVVEDKKQCFSCKNPKCNDKNRFICQCEENKEIQYFERVNTFCQVCNEFINTKTNGKNLEKKEIKAQRRFNIQDLRVWGIFNVYTAFTHFVIARTTRNEEDVAIRKQWTVDN